jgi:TolA-binding protein
VTEEGREGRAISGYPCLLRGLRVPLRAERSRSAAREAAGCRRRDAAVDAAAAAASRAQVPGGRAIRASGGDRRLGDLEIEGAREGLAEGPVPSQYRDAIRVYEDVLRSYPDNPGNDRVLYQLSHAYDQTGDLGRSLATLDRLVARYPRSRYRDEAEFRRGDLLFTLRRYLEAEKAYSVVLQKGDVVATDIPIEIATSIAAEERGEGEKKSSAFYERALYMHGWSLFKQARLEEALSSFAAVLDRKLIGRDNGAALEEIPGLTRAERELTEDTFRVVSLSLANLQGPDTIPKYFSTPPRRQYEFRVYQQLGELYLKQDRVADGADVFNAFARRYPTHLQSPALQSRAIQAYQQADFTALALEAKKEFVLRYGVESEFHRVNGELAYAQVAPYVRTHVEELARHYHSVAQKSRKDGDYQEAARWYRVYVSSFPADPRAPAMNFLLAESLFESKRFAAAAAEYERTAYDYPRHEKSADAAYAALLAYAQQEKLVKGDEQRVVRDRSAESALRFAEANPSDRRAAGVLTDAAERLYAGNNPGSAAITARRVLAMQPPPAPELRRTA